MHCRIRSFSSEFIIFRGNSPDRTKLQWLVLASLAGRPPQGPHKKQAVVRSLQQWEYMKHTLRQRLRQCSVTQIIRPLKIVSLRETWYPASKGALVEAPVERVTTDSFLYRQLASILSTKTMGTTFLTQRSTLSVRLENRGLKILDVNINLSILCLDYNSSNSNFTGASRVWGDL